MCVQEMKVSRMKKERKEKSWKLRVIGSVTSVNQRGVD